MSDPAAPELVADCLRRDYRWDWQVDEREVYLARLVRDLRLPVEPIAAGLFHAPAAKADDDHEFATTLGVLEVLGRAGIDGVVDEVRRYITHGKRWLEALTTVAVSWPTEYWDDLHPVLIGRLDAAASEDVLWRSPPWPRWAERDPRIAAAVHAAGARVRPLARPYAAESDDALLDLLAEPARAADWRPALRELRRRPPDLRLLDLVDGMLAADGAAATQIAPLLGLTLAELGAGAVPAARSWAATPGHPLRWTAFRLLAAHGADSDAPAVVAGLDWLDERPDDLCGYDELVVGLARIGGSASTAASPRLRRLWYSPHSYERPAYLRALVALDPTGAERFLVEGLWDCETDVRMLAVQRAPLTDMTRERLRYLRDDPIEHPDVRAATSGRLG
ncbi:hypothetical protein QLQ12_01170 [Actinoplanes sp. NEAU-A12]|uniref:HEAT repeat domain-containing protein n=1 Tax=Actinoplanes sandaracinus TaxID=3045177 RepID=A0ABT6WBU8_9ACTN|nr:hypothetical protein [Actinoplanes sandaracinus]MDI6097219.1 hypothetical protein [Actinoplanes sandaracinus]